MIGKLITWGPDRDTAMIRMRNALDELIIEGIEPTFLFIRSWFGITTL